MSDLDDGGCDGTGWLPGDIECEGCPDCDPEEEQWDSDLIDQNDEAGE